MYTQRNNNNAQADDGPRGPVKPQQARSFYRRRPGLFV